MIYILTSSIVLKYLKHLIINHLLIYDAMGNPLSDGVAPMVSIRNFFILSLALVFSLVAKDDYHIEFQPDALQVAFDLPCKGEINQKEDGYVYVDVSNDFINKVAPKIIMEGRLQTLPTAGRSMGAHISVFYEKENVQLEENHKNYPFQLTDIRSFVMNTRDGLKKLWVIGVTAPELENLRLKYGLNPLLQGHDYHITLGKQLPTAPEGWESKTSLSPLNFSSSETEPMTKSGDFVQVNHSNILQTAAKVNSVAQLKLKSNGFVYLDVNDRYIDDIVSQLPLSHPFSAVETGGKKMGAHISVIYEDEMISKEIWNLNEAGEWFIFEVKELRYIDRKTPTGLMRLWVLAADAPALQRLRKQYGLKPKLHGHDFHITLGSELLEAEIKEAA